MKNERLRKLVFASMLAAICCVTTMFIRIPTPSKGYINPGDCAVILTSWLVGPFYGFAAAGIGSAFADIFSGYVIYAPATFIIKGLMAIVSCLVYSKLYKKLKAVPSQIIAGIIAEIIMMSGYFIYETILYSLPTAISGMPGNIIQGTFGVVSSVLVYNVVFSGVSVLKKRKI